MRVIGVALWLFAFSLPAVAQTVNPYSPQYGHPYRHGAIPTQTARVLMRTWQDRYAPLASTGPNTLTYAGGSDGIGVQSGVPKVYLVVYGSQWGTAGTDGQNNMTLSNDPDGAVPFLQRLFEGIGTGGEQWSGIVTQYCDGALVLAGATSCPASADHVGYPAGGAFVDIWYDDSAPSPQAATASDLQQEAVNAATHFGNTTAVQNRYAQYVILSPPGTNPDGFNTVTGNFCAWHSDTVAAAGLIGYTNLPYVSDLASCEEQVTGGNGLALDTFSISATHEYAEGLTDFPADHGWFDPATQAANGGESADQCQAASPDALLVNTAYGGFAMQLVWSNDTNACEILHPTIVADTVFASAFE